MLFKTNFNVVATFCGKKAHCYETGVSSILPTTKAVKNTRKQRRGHAETDNLAQERNK